MSVHLIIGPMFARKTSTMIGELERYLAVGKRCMVVKHACDNRYIVAAVCTHSGTAFDACDIVSAATLHDVDATHADKVKSMDVIAVSESQFYPDLAKYLQKWANSGKIVVAEGLSGDFRQRPFTPMIDAVAIADIVTHLRAICMRCRIRDGSFTVRTSDERDQVVVGGADKYIAVCRACASTTMS